MSILQSARGVVPGILKPTSLFYHSTVVFAKIFQELKRCDVAYDK